MSELPADYLADVERRARRWQGQWTGTNGSIAADCVRLLKERKELMSTIANLERANDDLRAAVEGRIAAAEAACCEGVPLCQTIDTRGPMTTPDQEIAEDDELLDGHCVAVAEPEAMESAWAAIKAKHAELHRSLAGPTTEERCRVFSAAGPVSPGETRQSPAERLLQTAIDTVRQRRGTYGPPTEHFRITVGLLNAAFAEKIRHRLDAGELPFTLDDWPIVMLLDKVARDMGPGKSADTPVDLAGYAATLAECRQE